MNMNGTVVSIGRTSNLWRYEIRMEGEFVDYGTLYLSTKEKLYDLEQTVTLTIETSIDNRNNT